MWFLLARVDLGDEENEKTYVAVATTTWIVEVPSTVRYSVFTPIHYSNISKALSHYIWTYSSPCISKCDVFSVSSVNKPEVRKRVSKIRFDWIDTNFSGNSWCLDAGRVNSHSMRSELGMETRLKVADRRQTHSIHYLRLPKFHEDQSELDLEVESFWETRFELPECLTGAWSTQR